MPKRYTLTGKYHRTSYDNAAEYIADITNTPRPDYSPTSSSRADSSGWFGPDAGTWEAAHALLASGWRDGIDRVQAYRARALAAVVSELPRERIKYGPTGRIPMYARIAVGDPDCMARRVRDEPATKKGGRIVEITLNAANSAAIHGDTMERRGAAVCALIDALERTGRRVGVTLAYGIGTSTNAAANAAVLIRIKEPQNYVNPAVLAALLVHPGAFRRFGFRALELMPREAVSAVNLHSGYGYPADLPAADRRGIYVPKILSGSAWTEAAAERWIRENLAAQGVTLERR